MAKRPIVEAVPDAIRRRIVRHLREGIRAAENGWKNAPTSEDVLTGDLGRSLRTEWSDQAEAEGYLWRWRVQYRKFGAGNQYSSEENATGADGIIQVEVKRYRVGVSPVTAETVSLENIEEEASFHKGALFQSKRHDANDSKKLAEEASKIEELTPGHGVYIEYGPKGYRASLAKNVLMVDGAIPHLPPERCSSLSDFLAEQFMECLVGVEGMYVELEADPQILHLPNDTGAVRELGVRLGHALNVQVTGFKLVRFARG